MINEAKQKEQEKPEIKDKIAKETVNKELKEKEKKEMILTPISDEKAEKGKVVQQKEEQNKVYTATCNIYIHFSKHFINTWTFGIK